MNGPSVSFGSALRALRESLRLSQDAIAEAIRRKAVALLKAGGMYLDLRRLEFAPELTRQVAAALANGPFVDFGTSGGASGDHGAVTAGSDDVLRVVQTLMAAQVITGGGLAAKDGAPAAARLRPARSRSSCRRSGDRAAPDAHGERLRSARSRLLAGDLEAERRRTRRRLRRIVGRSRTRGIAW